MLTTEDLQKKKLELEISKLQVQWYNNIEFWKVAIPTFAVLASLYFTFGKGLIDSEKTRLEIQKEQLKLEISQFEIKKSSLADTIKIKERLSSNLGKQLSKYRKQRDSLFTQIKNLNSLKTHLSDENAKIKSLYNKDKTFYQDELRKQYSSERSHLQQLSSATDKINNQNVAIAGYKAQLEFLLTKANLNTIDKNQLDLIRLEANRKELDKQLNQHKIQLDKLDEEYKNISKDVDRMSDEELIRWFELYFLKNGN